MTRQAVLLIGIQASGKSTFYQERFFHTHLRINLDMLKTRNREARFLQTCLDTGQSFVVDNTNPTVSNRARYIGPAKAAGFHVVGYLMRTTTEDAIRRNAARTGRQHIPEVAIRGTYGRVEMPSHNEGFDELFAVEIVAGQFVVKKMSDHTH